MVVELIWKYWEPIKGFFSRLWSAIDSVFKRYPVLNWIFPIIGGARLIIQHWDAIRGFFSNLWNEVSAAFSGGISGVAALIVNWSPLGLFYKAFAGVMSWFGVDMPKNFTDFGANLVKGLVNGIANMAGAVKDAIGDLASGTVNWFKEKLGIKSPSRVFLGMGGFIGEGTEKGILGAIPGVQGAVGKLTGVALAGAMAVSSATPAMAGARDVGQAMLRIPTTAASQASAPGGGSGVSITFSPTINVSSGSAGGEDVRGQVQQAMQISMRELEQMLRRIQAEQQRRSF